jgi:hypothetical protein
MPVIVWAAEAFAAWALGSAAVTATFIAVSTIASIGIAYGLSRVINGNPNKGNNSASGSQGGRVQVPPATNNKIPVVYGNAYINGIITDARLKSIGGVKNDTMYYCIVLSETCNNAGAIYTVDNVYWNDLRLTFVDSTGSAHKVKDGRKNVENPDGVTEDFVDTNFIFENNSLVEVRVYADGSGSTDQIFPLQSSGNTTPAYTFWDNNSGTWTSANQMKGLVYAIVKVTWNSDKGFTSLPNITVQLDNSINNPADVWYDYMTSARYGANVSASEIDTTPTTGALDQWRDYCDELITYTPIGGGSTTQKRYTINGVIDTSRQVKDNIDIILQNGGAWLSYNVSTGYWQPIPKRAATAGELAAALQFSDDNIISGITISSTRLEDLYNMFEVEFYDKYNKDQKAYARLELDAADRNPNEPDNQLRMSLDLVNNSVQAELIGQLELRQSRDDLTISFVTNQYGIQAQAGDVIAVTSDLYDWSPKYFRVIRVKEIEGEDGSLTADIQALEYNPDVYAVEPITEFTTIANIGIGRLVSSVGLPFPDTPTITNVNYNDTVPNFTYNVLIPNTGGPFDEIEIYFTEGWDDQLVTMAVVPGTGVGGGGNGVPVGKGLMTVTVVEYNSLNAGDYFLVPDIIIESQLTQTSIPLKTCLSGGAIGSYTFTLSDVLGIVPGQKPVGTGIPSGTMVTGISGTTITLDNAFTTAAATTSGAYDFTTAGGTGTYQVDTSTTLASAARTLYDQPVNSDFKYLKKITPQGNASAFTSNTVISAVITELPANSQTYRRYFLKSRMGFKKNFGAFSSNATADLDGNVQWSPNPIGFLTTLVPNIITLDNPGPGTWNAPGAPLILRHIAGPGIADGFGTTMTYELQTPGSGLVVGGYHDVVMIDSTTGNEDMQWGIGLMKAGVPPSGGSGVAPTLRQFVIDSNGDVQITGNLTLNYEEDAASSIIYGKTNAADSSLTWNGVSWDFANNFGLALNNTTTPKGVQGIIAANDYWFVGGYDPSGTGSNNGAMVIASGNNGNEPIYVRQYGGGGNPSTGIPGANTITNELTLLDASGNTTLPGTLKLEGSTSGSIILSAGVAPTVTTYTLPSDGSNGYVLSTNGSGTLSWVARGDVVGPASATDNAVARFNLTTGELIQDSGVIIDDSNNIDQGLGSFIQGPSGDKTNTATINGTGTGTSALDLDVFNITTYRGGKYTIIFTKGTAYEIIDFLVVHNGTTPSLVVGERVSTSGVSLVTISVNISAGFMYVQGTPATTGTSEWAINRTLFAA